MSQRRPFHSLPPRPPSPRPVRPEVSRLMGNTQREQHAARMTHAWGA